MLYPGCRRFADACGPHVAPGTCERTLQIDRAAGVLDDAGVEAGGARIERRPGDAEVGGEAAQVELLEAFFLEEAGEAGSRLAVGFEKRRVAVDLAVMAFAHDELRMRC